MATLATRVRSMFFRMWRAYNRPTISVVLPPEQWTLPDGYEYDALTDRIANTDHTILPNPEDYWSTATVYIVPDSNPKETRNLIAQGVLPSGTVDVGVLADDVATVKTGHAVQLNGEWYDVAEVGDGIGAGWHSVRLTRRS